MGVGRVVASEKQGEPDTALNQLSRIQDSGIRQDDARFQRQKRTGKTVWTFPTRQRKGSDTGLHAARVRIGVAWWHLAVLHPEAAVSPADGVRVVWQLESTGSGLCCRG